MKHCLIIFLALSLFSINVFSDDTGYGCKIGQDFVYTRYLGKAPAYQGAAPVIYYDSNGPKIPIYWGYGCNDCRGYRCGYINVYGPTSYYDPQLKVNVPVPAENEMIYQGPQCVIAPSLGAPPVQTDSYVYYSYNKTNKCGVPKPENVPLDQNSWILMILAASVASFYIYKSKNNVLSL